MPPARRSLRRTWCFRAAQPTRFAQCGRRAITPRRTRSMGFCIFNNVAIGAAHALEAHGLERVAILDFDVHHGNGTEDAFHEDPRVLMCSTFQHPYYPYCGADSSNEHILNVPLPALTDSRGFRAAIEARLAARARRLQAAGGVRLGGIRRASRRPARLPQPRGRGLRLGHRAHSRGRRRARRGRHRIDAGRRVQHQRARAVASSSTSRCCRGKRGALSTSPAGPAGPQDAGFAFEPISFCRPSRLQFRVSMAVWMMPR